MTFQRLLRTLLPLAAAAALTACQAASTIAQAASPSVYQLAMLEDPAVASDPSPGDDVATDENTTGQYDESFFDDDVIDFDPTLDL